MLTDTYSIAVECIFNPVTSFNTGKKESTCGLTYLSYPGPSFSCPVQPSLWEAENEKGKMKNEFLISMRD